MRLDGETRAAIEAAIRRAEANSSCEFLAIIAERAGPGLWLSLVLALMGSFLAGLALWLFLPWAGAGDILLGQAGAFAILFFLLSTTGWGDRLLPPAARQRAAHLLALASFREFGLDATEMRNGILLFVARAERHVEIVADRGLHERVGKAAWEQIVADFAASAKAGHARQAFVTAIEALDRHMAAHFPIMPGDRNEIADRLIEI